ncbi:hypothetical protein G5714_011915 [Onychostoma macrolepis]|uniref:Uncharacterized protein n=1 Tax=Onychostoma macrolepis TaxID=369639 RepID=A0A7J6CK51_9TELE|nr:hypothetical protein G5714_011915 [Onychostoma macrolepis]
MQMFAICAHLSDSGMLKRAEQTGSEAQQERTGGWSMLTPSWVEMASSLPLETVMSCPRLDDRSRATAAPKSLAFSIDRIMSKTSEPKAAAAEEERRGGLEDPRRFCSQSAL